MVEYKPGIENIIVRKKFMILALVYSLRENDKVVIERRLDYSSYEDRKELGKLSFWAYQNHCSLETMKLEDAEAEMENGK